MIPNYHWKVRSGQNNYLGKVKSHNLKEIEMGYYRSRLKFVLQTETIKKQQVESSWSIKAKFKKILLRCTLMGFKRNYRIKCSFKQLKYFFTSHSDNRLNP